MSKLIKLQSSDGDVIAVPQKCAKMSHTIKDMLDTIAYSEFDQENEIPLPNVSTSSLKKIVEWMIQWQDQPQPSSEEIKDKLAETIDAWNEDFLKMDLNELYDLVSVTLLFLSIFSNFEILIRSPPPTTWTSRDCCGSQHARSPTWSKASRPTRSAKCSTSRTTGPRWSWSRCRRKISGARRSKVEAKLTDINGAGGQFKFYSILFNIFQSKMWTSLKAQIKRHFIRFFSFVCLMGFWNRFYGTWNDEIIITITIINSH